MTSPLADPNSHDDAPLDVALVGVGRRGWCHLEMLLATPGLRLSAICDKDPGRLAEAKQLAGPDTLALTKLSDLIATRPRFVVVCTMPPAQPGIALSLLNAGIPAMLEVPPGFDGPTIQRLVDKAEQANLPLGSLENYSRTPYERFKQQLILSGALGAVSRAEVSGSIGHKGHEIAVARRYIGLDARPVRAKATRVGGFQRHSGEGIAVPQGLSGTVEFDTGAEAAFELRGLDATSEKDLAAAELRSDFTAERGGCLDNQLYLTRNGKREHVVPERAMRMVADSEVPESIRLSEVPEVVWTNPFVDTRFPESRRPYLCRVDPHPQSWEIALADCYLDMAAAVRESRPAEYGVEYSLLDVRIRLAMIESTRRGGEWVDWQETPLPVEQEVRRRGWLRLLMRQRWLQPAFMLRSRLLGRG